MQRGLAPVRGEMQFSCLASKPGRLLGADMGKTSRYVKMAVWTDFYLTADRDGEEKREDEGGNPAAGGGGICLSARPRRYPAKIPRR